MGTWLETYLQAVTPPVPPLAELVLHRPGRAALASARSGLRRGFDVFRAEHERLTAALGLIEVRQRHLIGSLGPVRPVVDHRLEAAATAH